MRTVAVVQGIMIGSAHGFFNICLYGENANRRKNTETLSYESYFQASRAYISACFLNINWRHCENDSYYLQNVAVGSEKVIAAKNSGLYKPGEFTDSSHLSSERLLTIENICKNHMALPQALSLRKQILVDKVINSGSHLRRSEREIFRQYPKKSIQFLSEKFDQPAMSIFRLIIANKVRQLYPDIKEKDLKRTVKYALRYGNNQTASELSLTGSLIDPADERAVSRAWQLKTALEVMQDERDLQQLQAAKSLDQISYTDDYLSVLTVASAWEGSLYSFLRDQQVAFQTEEDLMQKGASSTPDVVFSDEDIQIDSRPVKWMDCKSFYGSHSSPHFLRSQLKQIKRYNEHFGGRGAIVFKLGYSLDLKAALSEEGIDCLVLDRGPLRLDPTELLDIQS